MPGENLGFSSASQRRAAGLGHRCYFLLRVMERGKKEKSGEGEGLYTCGAAARARTLGVITWQVDKAAFTECVYVRVLSGSRRGEVRE